MKPVELTRQELAKILEDFLKGSGTRWEWDDFLSSQIADENLERIRLRYSSLDTEFPPVQNGHFCSEEGLRLIKGYIVELRSTRNIGVPGKMRQSNEPRRDGIMGSTERA